MQLLMVGDGYTKCWDQKKVTLSESVVIITRLGSSNSCDCKDLD